MSALLSRLSSWLPGWLRPAGQAGRRATRETLVLLPPHDLRTGQVEASFDYVHLSAHGTREGRGAWAQLPRPSRGARVVLVVPAERCTLFAVQLPRLGRARLQAALLGVLEERVLGEWRDQCLAPLPEPGRQIHLVAACDQGWLHAVLARLEAVGLRPACAVPEAGLLEPGDAYLSHDASAPQTLRVLVRDSRGEAVLSRLQADETPWLSQTPRRLWCEPTLTAQLTARALSTELQSLTRAQWLARAANHAWDFLPYLPPAPQDRAASAARPTGVARLWHGPWRWPVRLVGAMVLINLIGLNAYAWLQHRRLDTVTRAQQNLAQQVLPPGTVVLDALAQVRNAHRAAREAAGLPQDDDIESLLSAAASLWPEARPSQMEYRDRRLRLTLPAPASPEACAALGLQCRSEDNQITLARAQVATGARP